MIAEAVHMTAVRRNRPAIKAGVMTTGNAVFAVPSTTANPISAATAKPMTALSSA